MTIDVQEWRQKGLKVVELNRQINSLEKVNLTMQADIKELRQEIKDLHKELRQAKELNAEEYFSTIGKRPVKEQIVKLVLRYYNITLEEVRGDYKGTTLVDIRKVMIYLLREHTVLSFADIGKVINRDHANCLHHYKNIQHQKPDYEDVITFVEDQLKQKMIDI